MHHVIVNPCVHGFFSQRASFTREAPWPASPIRSASGLRRRAAASPTGLHVDIPPGLNVLVHGEAAREHVGRAVLEQDAKHDFVRVVAVPPQVTCSALAVFIAALKPMSCELAMKVTSDAIGRLITS